jgi:hypothetical protein
MNSSHHKKHLCALHPNCNVALESIYSSKKKIERKKEEKEEEKKRNQLP